MASKKEEVKKIVGYHKKIKKIIDSNLKTAGMKTKVEKIMSLPADDIISLRQQYRESWLILKDLKLTDLGI